MSSEPPSLQRLLDLAVFAPIGMLTALRDELPAFSRQGRQVVTNRVMLAKFVGQLAVQQGRREIDKRLAARTAPATPTRHAEPSTVIDVAAPAIADEGPDADDLAIPDYESLPAANVVQRLATLTPDEVEQIRRFEAAHRRRRTILAKIDALQAP